MKTIDNKNLIDTGKYFSSKSFVLILISMIVFATAMQGQDSVEIELNSLDTFDETIELKNLSVMNCQLDSILRNIIDEKKGKFVSNYYLALAKHEENLYIEIINIDSHNNLITFLNRKISFDNYLRKGISILGCVIYNDSYFYVISFPDPNSVDKKDINYFFDYTNKNSIIKKEKLDDSFFFIESPMRLYQYKDGKLRLKNEDIQSLAETIYTIKDLLLVNPAGSLLEVAATGSVGDFEGMKAALPWLVVDAVTAGKGKMTRWGWEGTKVWKDLVKVVDKGGTIEKLIEKVPTQTEAIKFIKEAGGTIDRIDPAHLTPNLHSYPHINYTTSKGIKETIKIQ